MIKRHLFIWVGEFILVFQLKNWFGKKIYALYDKHLNIEVNNNLLYMCFQNSLR